MVAVQEKENIPPPPPLTPLPGGGGDDDDDDDENDDGDGSLFVVKGKRKPHRSRGLGKVGAGKNKRQKK